MSERIIEIMLIPVMLSAMMIVQNAFGNTTGGKLSAPQKETDFHGF